VAASLAVLLAGGLLPEAGAAAGGCHSVRADAPVVGIDGRPHVARCFSWLRQQCPQAQICVVADASQGVTTPGSNPATIPGPQVLRRGAQFTTRFDLEQVGFYGLMKAYHGPGTRCDDPATDWNRQMVSAMRDDRELLPRYRRYLASALPAAGTDYTVLAGPEFDSERSAGPAFNDWLSAMVGSADRQRRLQWRNVACLGCLIQLPCPNGWAPTAEPDLTTSADAVNAPANSF
jgi:hypothetical protein